ncbi:M14 family zinc carboxypeptidase [Nostoc sp. NMS4]|uniref:M14 family zinc carboxypeptidase n=1 Tax=Nostoc sp. NMS4 TaxID=2815390 RepID=UPI0025F7A72F|nr:M14 family zinc carboxypeptidase [Nostoc sp. NMS4]MBN3922880.1 hypothetical protein [Nostoc sp. NMS4]
MTVTNFATGAHQEKPVLWVDGNIHATELVPSSVCLYLLQTLDLLQKSLNHPSPTLPL